MAYKSVSDVDMSADGLMFGVEWEYESGAREWEWFDTADAREDAIEELKAMDVVDAEESEQEEDGLTDAEADAMTLASAGMGTDEDYGYFGDNDGY
jgi:phage FluMu protein gp41